MCGEETILFNPDQSKDSGVFGAYSVNTCNKNGEIYSGANKFKRGGKITGD